MYMFDWKGVNSYSSLYSLSYFAASQFLSTVYAVQVLDFDSLNSTNSTDTNLNVYSNLVLSAGHGVLNTETEIVKGLTVLEDANQDLH